MTTTAFAPTRLLDFDTPAIRRLIETRGWLLMDEESQLKAMYEFVRDEIVLGYNRRDDLPASRVLADGYGQCNTKAILLMALYRATGHAARLHAAWVEKQLQSGVIPPAVYGIAPPRILHTWVEVFFRSRWVGLEGVIVDRSFLSSVQSANPTCSGPFCGFAIATPSLASPAVNWTGNDTEIQSSAVVADLGVFEEPEALYAKHSQDLGLPRRILYEVMIRHWMNRRAAAIRRRKLEAGQMASRISAKIRSAIQLEYRMAETKEAAGDAFGAFAHLERAHILSQRDTRSHIQNHARMWGWAWRQRRWGELIGQSTRIVAAALFSRIWVPEGNTGGASVSALRPMPIPSDLVEILRP